MTHSKQPIKKPILPLVLMLSIGTALYFYLFSPSAARSAPTINYTTLEQTVITQEQLKNQPYIISFWRSDCSACLQEVPHFNDMQSKYQIPIIAVALQSDTLPAIQNIAKRMQIQYPIVYDHDGTITSAFGGIYVTPTTFIIGPKHNIQAQTIGLIDIPKTEQWIQQHQQE